MCGVILFVTHDVAVWVVKGS